ncbi:uncharacterized protein LOC143359218 [Halictus rubicundus]|uniref:uncharacterized protein LOC143359218 n=1 Tax=Halictus rubicundus TaxID=77578 RepID=UPI004036CCA3
MSIHTIIKAMKLGLISLSSCELSYFKCFNIYPYMLEFDSMWTCTYNFELISNLRAVGITEPDCWHIIIHGVGFQSACVLRHLLLSGIDIPGILNWQSPVNQSSEKIILFLKHIGIEQEVIELAEQYGIDEETEQILTDLGLEQMEEESSHEVICKCSLTVLEPHTCNSGITQSMNKVSESDSVSTIYDKIDYMQHDCQCGHAMETNTVEESTAQRNDYLRSERLMHALLFHFDFVTLLIL